MPTDVGFKARSSTATDAVEFHADQVTIDSVQALVERVKVVWGVPGSAVDASASNPLPVTDSALATALASIETTLTSILGGEATQATLASLLTQLTSFTSASHTDLVAILAKLTADPATQTTLAAVLAKLSSDPATQTTLAAVLAKLTSDPSTATNQTTQSGKLDTVHTDLAAILAKLTADPATQTTLAAVLAKLTSDPSTASAQTTQSTKLDTLHSDLGSILSKIVTSPALDSTLSSLVSANHTDLAAILTKLNGTITVAASGAGDVAGTLTDGRQTVSSAGTAVAIRGSLSCKWVTVTALLTNTAQVNVGGSGVLATSGGSTGSPLNAGDSVTIPVSNANLVFVDARVNGEGVSFTVGA